MPMVLQRWRIRLIPLASTLLLLGVTTSCGQTTAANETFECRPPRPSFAPRISWQSFEPLVDDHGDVMAAVGRDASVTIVAGCTRGSSIPTIVPTVVDAARTLTFVGGSVEGSGPTGFSYTYFPPTKERVLGIHVGSRVRSIELPPVDRASDCPLSGSGPISVVRCGAMADLTWSFRRDVPVHRIVGVEGEAVQRSRGSTRPLGFGYVRADARGRSILVRFLIARPQDGVVRLRINKIDIRDRGNRLMEHAIRPEPPLNARLRFSR